MLHHPEEEEKKSNAFLKNFFEKLSGLVIIHKAYL